MKLSDLRKRFADTGSAQAGSEPAQPGASTSSASKPAERVQAPEIKCDACGSYLTTSGDGPVYVLSCPTCGVCDECKKARAEDDTGLCTDCADAKRKAAARWWTTDIVSKIKAAGGDVSVVSMHMRADDLMTGMRARDMHRFACAACAAPASVYNPVAKCQQCQHDEARALERARTHPFACGRCGRSHVATWQGGTCAQGCTRPEKTRKPRSDR